MFLEKGRNLDTVRVIRNASGQTIARTVELAITRRTRNHGLLGRDSLGDGHALVIAPCASIHTWFMRFPIDVMFVARDGRVVKARSNIGPWRMAVAFGAHAAIEMRAGSIEALAIKPGDRLELI